LAKCVKLSNKVAALETKIAELKEDMKGATGSVLHGLAGQLALARRQLAQAKALQCKTVTVHFKSLLALNAAINAFINTQFTAMQTLFAQGDLIVIRGTTEDLSGNVALQPLLNLNVGQCRLGQPTADHNALFANRNNVGKNELVVYIVSTLIGGAGNFVGCATSPKGKPGAAVIQANANWLVAHEIGHVLGLRHVSTTVATNSDFLMWPNTSWTNVPPDLAPSEFTTMRKSGLAKPF
jgi:hypothetical protein